MPYILKDELTGEFHPYSEYTKKDKTTKEAAKIYTTFAGARNVCAGLQKGNAWESMQRNNWRPFIKRQWVVVDYLTDEIAHNGYKTTLKQSP